LNSSLYNIAENNQVTIYKVHIKDLENNRIFYAEYDNRYYDIRFMDAQENQLELMILVSRPKTGGVPEGTNHAVYNLKPETFTYWPHY